MAWIGEIILLNVKGMKGEKLLQLKIKDQSYVN